MEATGQPDDPTAEMFEQIIAGLQDAPAADDGQDTGRSLLSSSNPREVALALVAAYVNDDPDGFNSLVKEMNAVAPTHVAVMLAMAKIASSLALQGDLDDVPVQLFGAAMASQARDPMATATCAQLVQYMACGEDTSASGLMARAVTAWASQAGKDFVILDGYEMLVALAAQAESLLEDLADEEGMTAAELVAQIAMDEASRS